MKVTITYERADGTETEITVSESGPATARELIEAARMLPRGAIITDVEVSGV